MSVFGGADTGPVFVMAMSAKLLLTAGTSGPVMKLLFSGLSSGLSEPGVTLLMSVVPAALGETLTTIENVALSPAMSVAMLHATVPASSPTFGSEQVNIGPLFWILETNVAPVGSESVKWAPGASSGPRLPRVIVYVMLDPTVALPVADFVTNMSDDCAAALTAKRQETTRALHTGILQDIRNLFSVQLLQ